MKYYLGIDNGGTTTKAGLYTAIGKEIGLASVQTKMITPNPGFTERDMDEMWEANCQVIREVLQKSAIDPTDIAGIACCGHGKGLYLWGKDGKPARAGIISTDNRAWEYPLKWEKTGIAEKIFERSYQHIMACQPVSLLAWIQDHEPQTMDKIEWIFECKDYVRFRLTGEAFAEITDYSGANLINLKTKQYDNELLDLFGLSRIRDMLPPLCNSTDICGFITKEVAQKTGLAQGTPVAAGMFDIDACAIAVNVTDEEHICMIAGTWSINEYIRREAVLDGSVRMNSIFCIPDYYLIEESSATSAGNNEWFINTLLPELKEQADAQGENIYSLMDQEVLSVPVQEFCPIFTPFLMGSNVHPNAKASFVGISNYHKRKHLMRSIYEGIAFCHKYHIDKLIASRLTPAKSIRLAGGVAHSDIWSQIFADIMQYPVEIVDVGETGTLGCAINVTVAIRDYNNYTDAARNMVTIRKTLQPNPKNFAAYTAKYDMYKQVLTALNPIWDNMQKLMN
jgi:L-xylulokinase